MSLQKRPLPPTPKANKCFSTLDVIEEDLTEREKMLYQELLNCQKLIETKDSTINSLKRMVVECKKKTSDIEFDYKQLKQSFEEKERFLVKQHQVEMEAIINAQTNQSNENLDIILRLQKENDIIKKRSLESMEDTSYLSDTTETNDQIMNQILEHNKQNSDKLLEGINEMVLVITNQLNGLQETSQIKETPISKILSNESIETILDHSTKKKKMSKNNSISNFLFKHKKQDEKKRFFSLNESHRIVT